jgi:tetratricopeptide (TPR) repeat protein
MRRSGRIYTGVAWGVLLGLALAGAGCGGDAEARKIAYRQRGDAYYAAENYAAAVIEYKNTLQIDPQDAQTHYKLALASLKQGGLPHLQEAYRALQRSLDLDPTLLDAQLKFGELSLLVKQFDAAQEKAEIVLKGDPTQVEAHILLGHAYAGQQHLDQAIATLQTDLTLDPQRLTTYYHLARFYLLHKQPDAAERT